jgi:hypothetical protein
MALVCGVTLFGVCLPIVVRFVVCAAVAVGGIRCVKTLILLEGSQAIRAISWSDEDFVVFLGSKMSPQPATLDAAAFRFGVELWVLRFSTPLGLRSVLIVSRAQSARPFRRLCRRLIAQSRRASGRVNRPADTMPPKV